jgi:anaerobic magnesium-protoporphyrin IX monomethyl ester cyclase
LQNIPGLWYRTAEGIAHNPPRAHAVDLDENPYPAWHLFFMQRYQHHALLTGRAKISDNPFGPYDESTARQPEAVLEEIRWLVRRWGRKVIFMNDDTLILRMTQVRALCQLLLKQKLPVLWIGQADQLANLTEETLTLMRRAGCLRLLLALDSMDPVVRAALGKTETPEQIARTLEAVHHGGIQTLGAFTIGLSNDTVSRVETTLEFATKQRLDLLAFSLAIPFPKTTLRQYVEVQGKLLTDDYLSFRANPSEPVFETSEFSACERRQCLQRAQGIARSKNRSYHLQFWLPWNLYFRKTYEIRMELWFVLRVLLWPGRRFFYWLTNLGQRRNT